MVMGSKCDIGGVAWTIVTIRSSTLVHSGPVNFSSLSSSFRFSTKSSSSTCFSSMKDLGVSSLSSVMVSPFVCSLDSASVLVFAFPFCIGLQSLAKLDFERLDDSKVRW